MEVSTAICLNKYERLIKKVHKIGAGIEPTSSDNRSGILPLNYPIFALALNKTTYRTFYLKRIYFKTSMKNRYVN